MAQVNIFRDQLERRARRSMIMDVRLRLCDTPRNIYDNGRAYTEEQYRNWLAEAGFIDVERIAPPSLSFVQSGAETAKMASGPNFNNR
jgi:hypothetical protein